MKFAVFITIFFYQFSLFAEESIFLNKGNIAPTDGFLIPEETVHKFYQLNFDYKNLEQKNSINEKLLINKDTQIELLNKDNKNLSTSLYEAERRNKTILILTIAGVAVGMVLLTFAVGYAIKSSENIQIKTTPNTNMALIRF